MLSFASNYDFEAIINSEREGLSTHLVKGCLVWLTFMAFVVSFLFDDQTAAMHLLGWTLILGIGFGGMVLISAKSSRCGKILLGLGLICFPMIAMDSHSIGEMVMYGVVVAVVVCTVPFLIRFFSQMTSRYRGPQENVNLATIRDRLQCFDKFLTTILIIVASLIVSLLILLLVVSIQQEKADRDKFLGRNKLDEFYVFFENIFIIATLQTCAVALGIIWMIVAFRRSFQTRRFILNTPKPLREPLIEQFEEENNKGAMDDPESNQNETDRLLIV